MNMKKQRNNIVELARFLFSLLVIGYHVQMTWTGGGVQFFAGGALAVEFFFLISGFFFAKSVEKTSSQEHVRIIKETKRFMWRKFKGILPVHAVAILSMILVILFTKREEVGSLIAQGVPSIFLVQTAAVWNDSYQQALIVPEWYLSAMLLTMLIMFPFSLWLTGTLSAAAHPLFRAIPLFLKHWILNVGDVLMGDASCSQSLSNLGSVDVPDPMKPYLCDIRFLLGRSRGKAGSGSCVSYHDKLALSFTRKIHESAFERLFFSSLVEMGIPVEIESNRLR